MIIVWWVWWVLFFTGIVVDNSGLAALSAAMLLALAMMMEHG